MPIGPAKIKKPAVQTERAALVELQNGTDQFVEIARPAIGSEPHDLVFALVHLKPEILREHRIK